MYIHKFFLIIFFGISVSNSLAGSYPVEYLNQDFNRSLDISVKDTLIENGSKLEIKF